MKFLRHQGMLAGSFSLAMLTAVGAVAEDSAPAEAPNSAVTQSTGGATLAAQPELQPEPDPAFGGVPSAAQVVVPGMVAPVPAYGYGVAAPTVVGDYRVGHVHRAPLSRIFWYSTYNPYLDQLKSPIRARMFNNAHAPYYAGYRTVYNNVSTTTYYVPQVQSYAPGAYGYTISPPPADMAPVGVYGSNGPSAYAPYGVGSATYFGAYGPGQ